MGASLLLIRPLLRLNAPRRNTSHLVPLFILAVSNAGGLLTPLGDPPLLVGFIQGVPFFWTLRLWPAWVLYVGSAAAALYVVDRRAFAREEVPARLAGDGPPVRVRGAHTLLGLLAIMGASFLPTFVREGALLFVAAA